MKRYLCLIFFLLCMSAPCLAEDVAVHGTYWLGGMGMFLDYTEKEGSTVLDRDHGWLPGVDSGISVTERNWTFIFRGKYASTNNATYEGQTQGGVPLKFGHEYETIWTIEGNLGYTFKSVFNFTPYVGIGYRRWKRGKAQLVEDANGNLVWDYKEIYRWGYIPLGCRLEKTFSHKVFDFQIDMAILFPFSQDMTAYLSEIGGTDTGYDLGWRPGFRIEIPICWYFTPRSGLYVKPVYRYWGIGKSNTVTQISGNLIWQSYEPHSTTHYYGVSCGFIFRF